ncbi:MAG: hypothetical protein BWY35_01411 [Firmicutes bacterium ADurb.Bin248]|nr:MAG: hypothetical protein BWY35_01411 [Firmicutes bacterium ADurb.Bin248]
MESASTVFLLLPGRYGIGLYEISAAPGPIWNRPPTVFALAGGF